MPIYDVCLLYSMLEMSKKLGRATYIFFLKMKQDTTRYKIQDSSGTKPIVEI